MSSPFQPLFLLDAPQCTKCISIPGWENDQDPRILLADVPTELLRDIPTIVGRSLVSKVRSCQQWLPVKHYFCPRHVSIDVLQHSGLPLINNKALVRETVLLQSQGFRLWWWEVPEHPWRHGMWAQKIEKTLSWSNLGMSWRGFRSWKIWIQLLALPWWSLKSPNPTVYQRCAMILSSL